MSEFGRPKSLNGLGQGPSGHLATMVDTIERDAWEQTEALREELDRTAAGSAEAAGIRHKLIGVLETTVEALQSLVEEASAADRTYLASEIREYESEIADERMAAWAKPAETTTPETSLVPVSEELPVPLTEALSLRAKWLIGGGIALGLLAAIGSVTWWLTRK